MSSQNRSTAREAAELAAHLFDSGENCAVSVIKALRQAGGVDLPHGVEHFGAAYGGGIAYSGCVCGALAAGVMVLGWARGDGAPDGSDTDASKLAGRLKREFDRTCSGPCCESVREGLRFKNKKAKALCRRATAAAAAMTVDLLRSGVVSDEATRYVA